MVNNMEVKNDFQYSIRIMNNIDSFQKYYDLLVEENKKYNLTSITNEEEAFIKHFEDSICMNKAIDMNNVKTLCDIGSGAGFPSLPLKIVYPHLHVTIIEPTLKRVNFMKSVVGMLGLKDVEVINARAEDVARDYVEKFDVVTARALAALPMFLELTSTFCKVNGYLIAYKGSNFEEEIELSKNALKVLDLKIEKTEKFELKKEYGMRTLIKIKKIKETNNKYPRRFAEIKKKPL